MAIMATLEKHYRDLCDIEFTIERGKLWMLQTRVGKRTAAAAFLIAAQLVDEGLIDLDEALHRVTGAQLAQLMFPPFDARPRARADRQGHRTPRPAPPSARRSSTSARAVELAAAGEKVILVRRETNPDDLRRHDRRPGHPHPPRRQDLPRRRRRPRHGQDLRLRRRGARGRRRRRKTVHRRTGRPSTRATSSPSTAPPARSTSARCRCSRRRSCSTSRAASTRSTPTTRWSGPCTGS